MEEDRRPLSGTEAKTLRMTTEPVEKLVGELAIPTIISMLVTSFYNLADTFFVRQLDSDSMVAAVGVTLPLMALIQAVGFYFGHGSGNFISRAFGRRDYDSAGRMAAAGFFHAVLFGLGLTVLGLLLRERLAWLLGAKTADTARYTLGYMRYILLAAPFMTGAIVMNNQLRMQGNAFFSMLGLTCGAVLNLVLDPLLIFRAGDSIGSLTMPCGAGLGVTGAALATGLSQCVSFAVLAVGMSRSDNVQIRLKNFSFRFYYMREIFRGGLPSLARQGMSSVATVALNHSIGLYLAGTALIDATQAAMTGVSRIMMFLVSALIGFGQGFQPVCGFNYGARRYDRVVKAFFFCLKVAVAVLTLLCALGFLFARPITNLVAGTSPEAAGIAAFAFRAQLIMTPLMSWVILSNMMLQNIGSTAKATLIAVTRQGLSFLPMVLLLPLITRALGAGALLGIELAQPAADLLALLLALPLGWSELKNMRDAPVPTD